MSFMSFNATKRQFRERTKNVTRRCHKRPYKKGDVVVGVEKYRGVKVKDRVELGSIRIEDVRQEPLDAITKAEVVREGFPDMTVKEFIRMFCKVNSKCTSKKIITRYEYSYL